MLKKISVLAVALSVAGSTAVLAQAPAAATPPAGKTAGPCEQIVAACTSAGFVKGDYKQGYGLWVDCVDPIMRGTPQPAKADKPLPAVSSNVVAACKQKRPNFGEGKKPAAKGTS